MNNKLQISSDAAPLQTQGVVQNIHGGSGDILNNVGTVNYIVNYPGIEPYYPDEVNASYYNLFVVEKQAFNGTLAFSKSLALKESITDSVRDRFRKLGSEEKTEIYKIPSLFVTRNHHGRNTDDDHMAVYGFVKDLSIQGDLLVVRYGICFQIYQQMLNKFEDILQLDYAPDANELDCVHWTIKEVNLKKILGV